MRDLNLQSDVVKVLAAPMFLAAHPGMPTRIDRWAASASALVLVAGLTATGVKFVASWLLVGVLIAGWSGVTFGFALTRDLGSRVNLVVRVFGACVVGAWLLLLCVLAVQPTVHRVVPIAMLVAALALAYIGIRSYRHSQSRA
jgi:hypothetical protein